MAVPPSADGAAAVAAVVVDLTQDAAGPGVDADVQAPPAKKARTGDPIDADDQVRSTRARHRFPADTRTHTPPCGHRRH